MHPFNRYSQIKSTLRNLVCKEHFYISTSRRETQFFPIDYILNKILNTKFPLANTKFPPGGEFPWLRTPAL